MKPPTSTSTSTQLNERWLHNNNKEYYFNTRMMVMVTWMSSPEENLVWFSWFSLVCVLNEHTTQEYGLYFTHTFVLWNWVGRFSSSINSLPNLPRLSEDIAFQSLSWIVYLSHSLSISDWSYTATLHTFQLTTFTYSLSIPQTILSPFSSTNSCPYYSALAL